MPSEIEKRFRFDPHHQGDIPLPFRGYTLEQHYLSLKPQVRIRRKFVTGKIEESYTITTKKGVGLIREEHECPISFGVFEGLKSAALGGLLKQRYEFDHLGRKFFLDIFIGGPLAGKMFIEVEFDSIADADDFDLIKRDLPWLGEDIMHLKDYPNYAAAGLADPNQ